MCVWIKPGLLLWTFRYKIKKKQNMLKMFQWGMKLALSHLCFHNKTCTNRDIRFIFTTTMVLLS